MARYLITFDDGSTQNLTADTVEYDGDQYTAYANNQVKAFIQPLDVRSIVRLDGQAADA
ncbi:hypothetical protein [Streptomyces spectabilis]|uniref:Uncharacterized protein n=1 Tax=Streptomyces spectabilis TaxID=68270 RepID=A0A7W8EYP7_STRST|nr:hypothetical protein [Streptomyces spectabilis]MBB5108299.1 hypothetical protein [Streptomyces spectabilis]MCI3901058.1 hypothetical protein [Streptomyces spectabilis]GGV45715.1 hypothetical protein GCM10010245_71610 [Streptomyces spectabilis]